MPSKISLFNRGVILQDIRSVGWISILYSFLLIFTIPLQLMMMYSNEEKHFYFHNQDMNPLFMIIREFQVLLIVVVPVVVAIILFRYLQVKQSTDMIHSLPISRKVLYQHHILIGILTLVIPVILTALLTGILNALLPLNEVITFNYKDLLYWIGITILMNVFIFVFCACVAIFTGISAVQGVLTYILLLFPAGIAVLVCQNLRYFIYGYPVDAYLNTNIQSFTPIIRLLDNPYQLFSWIEITIYVLLTILFYVLGISAYQRRKVESATQAIAFRYLRPVFKYGVTFCMMLLGGMYFGETQGDLSWIYTGFVIGSVIGYYVAEMVLQKTWRVFSKMKGYIPFVAVMVIVGLILQLDITGYEKRTPDFNEIKRAYFGDHVHYFTDEQQHPSYVQRERAYMIDPKNRFFFKEEETIKEIVKLHQKIIKDQEPLHDPRKRYYRNVVIGYELNNGDRIIRQYKIPEDKYSSYYKPIYESLEYKRSHYELLRLESSDRVEKITINAHNMIPKTLLIIEPELIKEAIAILQEDMKQETYEEIMLEHESWASIEMLVEKDNQIYHMHMSWEKSYENFERWLDEHNLLSEARIMSEDIDYAIVVKDDRPSGEFEKETYHIDFKTHPGALRIEGKDKLEECLRNYTWSGSGNYIIAFYRNDNATPMIEGFNNDRVPSFILEHFE